MNRKYTISTKNLDGWWSAVCKELCVSGFGETEQAAIEAAMRSMRTTLAAKESAKKRHKPHAALAHAA